jgi:hypothetical protein
VFPVLESLRTTSHTQSIVCSSVGCREPDAVGGPVTRLPQDLHFEESHGRVGPISKVGWSEVQAGLLVRHFLDWQRVRPRPQGRGGDRGRPTGPVVGRHPVQVEEGDGARPSDSGGRMVLLPAWLRHCGTVSAGTEQVLMKKTGAGGKNG